MQKRAWIALVAIYLFSRLYQLEHWPVWTADEGLLALPAARWWIERDPFPDGFPNAIRFPLWTLLLGGLYGIAGPDLMVGRLLSVTTGLLALVLLIRATGPHTGIEGRRCLVVVAFLCDFVLLRYQRYGLVESSLCLLLLLVGRLWGRSESVRVGRLRVEARVIAAAALAAALLLKLTAIVVLPGLVCHAWILARRARRPVTARLVVELLPPLLVALEIYLLLGCLYPDRFTAAWSPYLARSADLANSRLRSATIVLVASPGLWALALAGVWNRRRSLDPEDGLLMTWLGVGGAVLLLLPAPPVRYFMAVYPALIILAARWGAELPAGGKEIQSSAPLTSTRGSPASSNLAAIGHERSRTSLRREFEVFPQVIQTTCGGAPWISSSLTKSRSLVSTTALATRAWAKMSLSVARTNPSSRTGSASTWNCSASQPAMVGGSCASNQTFMLPAWGDPVGGWRTVGRQRCRPPPGQEAPQ